MSLDDIESGKFNIDYPNERIDVPIEFSITEDKMKEFFLSPQKFNAILDELKKIVSDSGLSISPSPTQEQRDEFTELLEDCSSSEKELIKSYIKFVSNVAAGTNNTVAELDDGYVYTWSRNTEWQLGKFDGTSSTYDVSTPAYTGERAEDLIEFFDAEGNKINYLTTIETGATLSLIHI